MQKTNLYKVTPVFEANFKAYYDNGVSVVSNQGSSRSSKTYSIIQLLIYICFNEPNTFVSVVSCTLPHLKRGAIKDFKSIMLSLNIFDDSRYNLTDQFYKFLNGSIIEFFSADNSSKLRGAGRKILFINEANLIGFDSYRELEIRTQKKIIIDFNPADDDSWVYNVSILPKTCFIKSTYRNNLANLPPEQIERIENLNPATNLITGDYNAWRVFGLGERGSSGLTIYTHQRIYKDIPNNVKVHDVFYGLDFGVNDPNAFIKVIKTDVGFFCDQVIYKGSVISDFIKQLEEFDISKNAYIYADTSDLGAIIELQRAGYNVVKAKKDVKTGISKVKSVPIYLHENSLDLIKDFKNYKWKTKNEKPIDEPAHPFSHSPDAVRYAIFTNEFYGNFELTAKQKQYEYSPKNLF